MGPRSGVIRWARGLEEICQEVSARGEAREDREGRLRFGRSISLQNMAFAVWIVCEVGQVYGQGAVLGVQKASGEGAYRIFI